MWTIEVYSITGEHQRILSTMNFLKKKEFETMQRRILSGAAFNSLRRDRNSCCLIKTLTANGFEDTYYADSVTSIIKNICNEYDEIFKLAAKIAKAQVWRLAWKYSGASWRHRAILKRMSKARKVYEKETIIVPEQ